MKLGFIGMGNMATALARGFIGSGLVNAADVAAFDPNKEKLERTAAELGFCALDSERAVAAYADIVVMACKPHHVEGAVEKMREALGAKALLSIALGWDFDRYRAMLPADTRVQFVMPNTPAMIGEGMFLFEGKTDLFAEELDFLHTLFGAIGEVETLESAQMAIGGALSGCGPAFVDLLIEAFADAGVRYGLPRDKAMRLVSKTVAGSGALQLKTGLHPGVLKDMVCSPGGSTIKGVAALEQNGFRGAAISAIDAIMQK